jgi:DinB superfamily
VYSPSGVIVPHDAPEQPAPKTFQITFLPAGRFAAAPINQDDWAKNLGYLESSPPELVALYGLNRQANVRLLRRLKADDLHKSARHPELDHRVTVADYVKMMAKHGPNHLEQIKRLKKEAMGKQN